MKVLVLGASPNPERASYFAVDYLKNLSMEVYAVGNRAGIIQGVSIQKEMPDIKNIDTITIYLSAQNQKDYYDSIFALNPRRLIFNPGAENHELKAIATGKGIIVVESCTFTLLSAGMF